MNISKFILIDAALAIAVMSILFLILDSKNSSFLLSSFNQEKLSRKISVQLPDKEKLIELEKIAKNQGSGIEFNSLLGNWKFVSVLQKDICKENLLFSSLLRLFSAKIKFKKDFSKKNLDGYSVFSSIQFGIFTIEFSGSGCLKGKQPLLTYFLNLIELKSGAKTLLSRSLKEPEGREKSFFSLIALEENSKWLSARGQGDAVVIWLKD